MHEKAGSIEAVKTLEELLTGRLGFSSRDQCEYLFLGILGILNTAHPSVAFFVCRHKQIIPFRAAFPILAVHRTST